MSTENAHKKFVTIDQPEIKLINKIKNTVDTVIKVLNGEYFDQDGEIHNGDVERARQVSQVKINETKAKARIHQMNIR